MGISHFETPNSEMATFSNWETASRFKVVLENRSPWQRLNVTHSLCGTCVPDELY
jgi:hypothetical protein